MYNELWVWTLPEIVHLGSYEHYTKDTDELADIHSWPDWPSKEIMCLPKPQAAGTEGRQICVEALG